VRAGVAAVQRGANLRGKPTIIVHGRNDTLAPPNFSSRPNVLRNAQVEGAASRVRCIEVTNAQHFDASPPFPGYDTRYVPLHRCFIRAMDAMWAHLQPAGAHRARWRHAGRGQPDRGRQRAGLRGEPPRS
jgi:hydroxybutyrate-dimer hydrolase